MAVQMSRDMKRQESLRLFREKMNRSQICTRVGVSWSTLSMWLKDAGLLNPDKTYHPCTEKRKDTTNLVRVNRDPCPRCNTRGDLGCAHRPAQMEEPFA